jgi:hypothetical protein
MATGARPGWTRYAGLSVSWGWLESPMQPAGHAPVHDRGRGGRGRRLEPTVDGRARLILRLRLRAGRSLRGLGYRALMEVGARHHDPTNTVRHQGSRRMPRGPARCTPSSVRSSPYRGQGGFEGDGEPFARLPITLGLAGHGGETGSVSWHCLEHQRRTPGSPWPAGRRFLWPATRPACPHATRRVAPESHRRGLRAKTPRRARRGRS